MGLSIAEQWKAEGKAEGEAAAAREMLAAVLEARFGPVPETVRQALATAAAERVKEWHRLALTAPTLEAIGIAAPER